MWRTALIVLAIWIPVWTIAWFLTPADWIGPGGSRAYKPPMFTPQRTQEMRP